MMIISFSFSSHESHISSHNEPPKQCQKQVRRQAVQLFQARSGGQEGPSQARVPASCSRRSRDPGCVGLADRARTEAEGESSFVDRSPSRGRPPRALGSDAQEVIALKMPTTSHHVKNAVLEKAGQLVSDRIVCREPKKMKFTYVQGQQRVPRADERSSVKYRLQYLTVKRSNLTARQLPKRPEIYLDESYCNANHVARKTWIEKGAPRYMTAGAGPSYCIVGGGALLVRNGRSAWPSHLKQSDSDYHINFTKALFERWFESLCATLARPYSPCRVHMDGASYHKRILNPAPTTSTKKQAILDWLLSEGIPIDNPKLLTKKLLFSNVAQVRAPKRYSSVE
ncbi:hypothetical protein PybrP1_013073, partial [[Pythium] brassicae (nom. inval.)]